MIRTTAFLQKTIGREEIDHGILSSTLKQLGYLAPLKKIHDLKKSGVLIGIKKGLYVFSPEYSRESIRKETLANLIYGPSCISLEYALSYYGFIPERVETLTSITPKRDKLFQTPVGTFTYRHLSSEKYREQIDLIWLDPKHPILIASPEKALADYIVLNKLPSLKTKKEAYIFLEKDLRIDLSQSKRLDIIKLHQLNRIYKSQNLNRVIEALEVKR